MSHNGLHSASPSETALRPRCQNCGCAYTPRPKSAGGRPKLYCSEECCAQYNHQRQTARRRINQPLRSDARGNQRLERGNHPTNWIATAAEASPRDLAQVLLAMINANPEAEIIWAVLEAVRRQQQSKGVASC